MPRGPAAAFGAHDQGRIPQRRQRQRHAHRHGMAAVLFGELDFVDAHVAPVVELRQPLVGQLTPRGIVDAKGGLRLIAKELVELRPVDAGSAAPVRPARRAAAVSGLKTTTRSSSLLTSPSTLAAIWRVASRVSRSLICRDWLKRYFMSSWTTSMLQPQIESCGWFCSSHFQATSRKPCGGSARRPRCAQALKGSAHWQSSVSHSAFACLIHTRLDSTPGITHCWSS